MTAAVFGTLHPNTKQGFPCSPRSLNFAASKSEARRLIEQGAARVNDEPVKDIDFKITRANINEDGYVKISSGKKKHALLTLG